MEIDRSGSLEGLRASNRERVFATLRRHGVMSRADIARRTGLSRSTISVLVGELQSEGTIHEVHDDRSEAYGSHGGRPPVLIALDPSAGAVIGVDFGHRHLRVGVADLSHAVLAEDSVQMDVDMSASDGLDAAAVMVDKVLAAAGISRPEVRGVGLGVPGPVDRASGTIGSSSILPGWVGVRAAAELGARLGLAVRVDNDANLGALAEMTWGAGRGFSEVVYLKVSTGIGAGLILGARLYRGSMGLAGELGHITLDESGEFCRCGNRGCLETVAGAAALERLVAGSGRGDRSLNRIVAAAIEGEPASQRVVADAGMALGAAVALIANAFNPEIIIVNGEVARAGAMLLDPLLMAARRRAVRAAMDGVEVVASTLGERAELLGAIALHLSDETQQGVTPVAAARLRH